MPKLNCSQLNCSCPYFFNRPDLDVTWGLQSILHNTVSDLKAQIQNAKNHTVFDRFNEISSFASFVILTTPQTFWNRFDRSRSSRSTALGAIWRLGAVFAIYI